MHNWSWTDKFYLFAHPDYGFHIHCYTHIVSADASFGLLQVIYEELTSPWIK